MVGGAGAQSDKLREREREREREDWVMSMTIELEEKNMKGHKLFCDLVYLGGELAGCPGCRWAVVVGYDISMFHMDCYVFPVKPTKRQLRSLKRKYR